MKKALIFLAEGFEEMEAVISADLLRRAGIEVVTAGIEGIDVTGAHGISVLADCKLDEIDEDFDAVIVPGGMPGASNIAASDRAVEMIKKYFSEGKLVAAICAAPAVVLAAAEVVSGKKVTCFPGFENKFGKDVKYTDSRVVADGNLITAKGPGAAAEFAGAVIEYLAGKDTAVKVLSSSFFI